MALWRIETVFTGAQAGLPGLSTFHFADPLADNLQEAVDATSAFWGTVRNKMSTGTTIQVASRVLDIDTDPATINEDYTTPASVQGVDATEPLPWATQGLITWRTALASRSGRGRTFVPSPGDAQNNSGVPIGTYTSNLQAAADTLIGTGPGGTWWFTLWSRVRGAEEIITGATARPYWAVLRSRRD